jgi:P4 family phage/plasmid primase-like protien
MSENNTAISCETQCSTPLDTPADLLTMHVSVFRGVKPRPADCFTLDLALQYIRNGEYARQVAELRQVLDTQGTDAYDDARKKDLPGFTMAGIFAHRANARLTEANGLVTFDIDDLPDPAATKALLIADPYVALAFISLSSKGLKFSVRTDGIVDDRTYKHAWHAILAYFACTYPDLAVANDKTCKDISRLCFVSHDPDLYINPQPQRFIVPPEAPSAAKPKPTGTTRAQGPQTPGADAIPADRRERYARQAIDTAVQMIQAGSPKTDTTRGTRHDTQLRAARLLGGYVAGGVLSQTEAYAALEGAVASNTSDVAGDMETIMDGLRYGEAEPITLEQLEAERQDWLETRATMAVSHTSPPPAGTIPKNAPASTEPALPYSDYTNAVAFVRDHGTRLRYCHPWGKWLVWTGTHWDMEATGEVMRLAKETIKRLARQIPDLGDKESDALLRHIKASLSTVKLKAMIENAQSELPLPVPPEALDRDPWLLNVVNGTLDLRTGALPPHRREDLLTRCLPVAYDAQALCPTWDSFLRRILAGNTNLISFVQRAVGYALTGVIREHVLLILWGSGRNGKSTFLNTLRTLLGSYAIKASAELLMISNSDRHPTERTDLFQKRFVAVIETEQGRRMAEVFVKEATGGDPIRARRMREDMWEFQPTHKLWLATNHKPTIKGTDNAIWERMRLVPFTVTIPPAERDTTLPDKLQAELPGILAWAVRGCMAWQQEGLGESEEVTTATAGYRAEMDVIGRFLTEECSLGTNAVNGTTYKTAASLLHKTYQQWSGDTSISPYALKQALEDRGYTNKREKTGMFWQGIGVQSRLVVNEDRKDLEK